jgi:hypothetical protein
MVWLYFSPRQGGRAHQLVLQSGHYLPLYLSVGGRGWKTPVCLSVWFECRYLGWRNARTVSNFFYTSHMVKDYYLTLLQDLNKGQGLHLTKLYTATKDLT